MCEKTGFPKVLVISHNAFSTTGNMGKTLSDMLACVPDDNTAQLFFHNDTPDSDCRCQNYYRVTDVDMVKSVFGRKAEYKIYTGENLAAKTETISAEKSGGAVHNIYQYSRRRTPFIYMARNLLWNIGVWNTAELDNWIKNFSPDVIFFACGDYAFAYKIVYKIARKLGIRVIPWCSDDFCLKQLKPHWFMQRIVRANLEKWTRKVFSLSDSVVTINDKMARDYAAHFGIRTNVMRISADIPEKHTSYTQRSGICYIGNLGVGRTAPLLQFADALHSAQLKGLEKIHVYSGEKNQDTIDMLKNCSGVVYHGSVTADEVKKLHSKTRYLLHTENSALHFKNRTRYSLSTKIGEYLASGACIVAYGPKDIASMEYLAAGGGALCSDNVHELIQLIAAAENDADIYTDTVNNSLEMVQKYHNRQSNNNLMKNIICFSAGQRK